MEVYSQDIEQLLRSTLEDTTASKHDIASCVKMTTEEKNLNSACDRNPTLKSSNEKCILISSTSTLPSSVLSPGSTRPKLLAELTSVRSLPVTCLSSPALTKQTVSKDSGIRSESPIIIIENISKVLPQSFHSQGQKNLMSSESQSFVTKAKSSVHGGRPALLANAPIMSVSHDPNTKKDTSLIESSRNSKEMYKCEDCDYVSNNKHYLKQHVDLVHLADRPYKCPFCDYAGKRSHSLREHLIVHSNERPYECSHCNATFRKKGHLTNHTKLHQKTVFCNTCHKSIIHSELEAHVKTCHTRDNVFVCELCSFVAPDEAAILEHIKVHQSQQIYVCSTCKHMTNDFSAFVAHAETHRETPPSTILSSAELKSAAIKADLKETILSKRPHDPEQVKEPPISKSQSVIMAKQPNKQDLLLKCSECGFVAPTTTLMKNHMWTHLQTMPPLSSPQEENSSPEKLNLEEKSGKKLIERDLMGDQACKFVMQMLTPKPELPKSNVNITQELVKQSKNILSASEESANLQSRLPIDSASSSSQVQFSSSSQSNIMLSPSKTLTTVSSSIIKQDLKESILAKQQKVPAMQNDDKEKFTELPPFVHDKLNARYLCTICGYTCEFQRTIKAHIWKHSGNQDIEYPMFQNGPLSIYDSETKSCVNLTPSSVFMVEKEQNIQQEPDSATKPVTSNEEQDSKVTVNSVSVPSSVSVVTPALAHLLAARAMTGLKHSENFPKPVEPDSRIKDGAEVADRPVVSNESEVQTTIKSVIQSNLTKCPTVDQHVGTDLMSKIPSESKEGKLIKLVVAEKEQVSTAQDTQPVHSESNKNGNTEEEMDTQSAAETSSDDKSDPSKVDGSPLETNSGLSQAKKRKLYESKYDVNEMLQMVKLFCSADEQEEAEEKGNVVVETVDSVSSLTGLTGMKSQQGSPRASSNVLGSTEGETTGGSEQDMECADSGFLSDSNSSLSQVTSRTGHTYMSTRSVTRQSTRNDQEVKSLSTKEENVSKRKVRKVTIHGKGKENSDNNSCVDDSSLPNKNFADHGELTKPDTKNEEESQVIKPPSLAESAVTLLSLLKKGPNSNPACPPLIEEINPSQAVDTTAEESQKVNTEKPKSRGISSSLLAVIEQLRERSRSETDYEEPGKKGVKKRSRRLSTEDEDPIENIDNVERIEDAEDEESRFRCKLCHYSNSSTFVMKQHMRLHKTKRPFECSLCDFMAESSEDLQNHMIKHCKVRTYQCKLCTSAFNYKSQLRAHMRAHNEKDLFACEECDFETSNLNLLRNHMNICHEIKQYVCEVCEQRFSSKQQLRTHKKLSCQGLDDRSLSPNPMENLGKKQHNDPKSPGKNQKQEFRCAKCDYVTHSFARFGNHMKSHEEPKVLKCDLCDFPAVSNRSLKSHMKRHINDQRFVQQPLEQYKCNLCGYLCHHLPSLKSHMWRHASDENYSYEFTNEVINAAIDYDSRLDTKECCEEDVTEFNKTIREKMRQRLASQGITKEADSVCAVCWVTFRCCQCGFEVINKAQLNLHMKTHSDVIQWTLQVSQNNAGGNSPINGRSKASTTDGSIGHCSAKDMSDKKELEVK